MRWSSAPAPILAAAACIASIGRAIRRASTTLVAIARSRNATSSSAVRQIAESSGANASLNGSSTNTHHPSDSIRLVRAEHLRPVVVAPGRHGPSPALRPPSAARLRTCGSDGEARPLQHQVRCPGGRSARPPSRWRTRSRPSRSAPARSPAERTSGRSRRRPRRARAGLRDGDRHVRLGAVLEADRAEVLLRISPAPGRTSGLFEKSTPLSERSMSNGETADPLLARQRRGSSAGSPASRAPARRWYSRSRSRSPVAAVRLRSAGPSASIWSQDVLHVLLDRRGVGGRLVALDARQRALAVLVREVELREPARDDRRGDERHDDRHVLPDQAAVRPCGRFHLCALAAPATDGRCRPG